MIINEEITSTLGLSSKETYIYELLLEENKATAGILIQKSNYKRATVYTVLESLIQKGTVETIEIAPVMEYRAKHPYVLKELAEQKVRQINTAEQGLEAILPSLTHLYNSHQTRPGVVFYEGKEGIQKVLNDSLTSKEEILSYVDVESVMEYIPEINKKYVAKREKLGIKKRSIIMDSSEVKKYLPSYHLEITESRLIPAPEKPFKTVMQIYDNKISYITLSKDSMIGVIISDVLIYQMHKHIFEHLWNITSKPSKSVRNY